jgi:hypothetical protein
MRHGILQEQEIERTDIDTRSGQKEKIDPENTLYAGRRTRNLLLTTKKQQFKQEWTAQKKEGMSMYSILRILMHPPKMTKNGRSEDFDDDDDAILFADEMMEGDEDFEYDGALRRLVPRH